MDMRYKGDGNLVPYLGKAKRRWKTYLDSGVILKDKVYYIENIIEPIGHMFNDENVKVYGINVYQINGNYKKYLFSMNKNKIDKYFKPMTQESFSKSIKLIIEAVNGKKGFKEFSSLSDVKKFVSKNRNVIKEAKIMEGPLGSGGWTPKKAISNFKKKHEKSKKLNQINSIKDSFSKTIKEYLNDIVKKINYNKDSFVNYGCNFDDKGYYIWATDFYDGPVTHTIDDNGVFRNVKFDSEKYKNKIYMPKLTKYIEKYQSLPSEKQLREYLIALFDNRYNQNIKKDRLIKPERHLSRTDVDNFSSTTESVKEAKIMEGPLGSGGWTPKKALSQIKKSNSKYDQYHDISYEKKDAEGLAKLDVLNKILQKLKNNFSTGIFSYDTEIKFDKHGYYIVMGENSAKAMEFDDKVKNVSPLSDKYNEIIRLPKLSMYVKTHDKLPSENQLLQYFKDSINKRYNNNYKKMNNLSHTSKSDVEDF